MIPLENILLCIRGWQPFRQHTCRLCLVSFVYCVFVSINNQKDLDTRQPLHAKNAGEIYRAMRVGVAIGQNSGILLKDT